MSFLTESSLTDLYYSAVKAFPKTTKRQHAVDPIIIEELRWTPFKGVKTLFIRAEARNETRHYSPMILFKNVNYDNGRVKIVASDGLEYRFAPLSMEDNDVLVRCNCPDFKWRFNYYDHEDHSLYGRVRAPYESKGGPPANPQELPGMCKHLMKAVIVLRDAGIFSD
jgi:hypothetical protein